MKTKSHIEGSNPSVTSIARKLAVTGSEAFMPAGGRFLLSVNAGVDACEALAQASNIMSVVCELTDVAASREDGADIAWGAHYLATLAKGILDAVHVGQNAPPVQ